MEKLLILILLFLYLGTLEAYDSCQPLWPRIQFGNIFSEESNPEKIVIKFNTKTPCPKSYITVTDSRGSIRKSYCQNFSLKMSQKMNNYQTFIQRCSIVAIEFEQIIGYVIYGANTTSGTSIPFNVNPINTTIFHPNTNRTVKLIFLADWGELKIKINQYTSLNSSLNKVLNQQKIDGLIINGDIAYDLDSNNGENYQSFLNLLSRFCRYIPVFINTGNHQHNSEDDMQLFYGTFEQYGKDKRLAAGLNLGPLFFIGIDPYQILYKDKDDNLRKNQGKVTDTQSYKGLKQMLKKGQLTNKYMVTSSHYPFICSADTKNCQNDKIYLKDFFDLMFKYGVKFYIGAHYHVYQRIFPLCQNGQIQIMETPYILANKKCLVSILQGIAGNDDKIIETYQKVKSYTAALSYGKTGFGIAEFGITSMKYQHFSTINVMTLQDQFEVIFKTGKKSNNMKIYQIFTNNENKK